MFYNTKYSTSQIICSYYNSIIYYIQYNCLRVAIRNCIIFYYACSWQARLKPNPPWGANEISGVLGGLRVRRVMYLQGPYMQNDHIRSSIHILIVSFDLFDLFYKFDVECFSWQFPLRLPGFGQAQAGQWIVPCWSCNYLFFFCIFVHLSVRLSIHIFCPLFCFCWCLSFWHLYFSSCCNFYLFLGNYGFLPNVVFGGKSLHLGGIVPPNPYIWPWQLGKCLKWNALTLHDFCSVEILTVTYLSISHPSLLHSSFFFSCLSGPGSHASSHDPSVSTRPAVSGCRRRGAARLPLPTRHVLQARYTVSHKHCRPSVS